MLELKKELKDMYRKNALPLVRKMADIRTELYFPELDICIGPEQILQDSFELEECLCSDTDLTFGACESAELRLTLADVKAELKGKCFVLTHTIEGETVALGTYIVDSAKRQDNLRFMDIVAYDSMQKLDIDVSEWYHALTFPLTLREFRLSLLAYCGLDTCEQELVNDEMLVEKTIEASELSGREVARAIGEISGAFGHINRQGLFKYIDLSALALYPSETLYPSEDLYPLDPSESFTENSYITTRYEDYTVQGITGLRLRSEEEDTGAFTGTEENVYTVTGNFLLYGKNGDELKAVAENMFAAIKGHMYTPHETNMIGLPYIEVGDTILNANGTDRELLVMKRILRGITSFTDEISASGSETLPESEVHSTEYRQLEAKTLKITKTVDRLKISMEDFAAQMESSFEQTAESLTAEVKRAQGAEEILSASLKITAEGVTSEVNRATEAEEALSSSIKQTAESLQLSVEDLTNSTNAKLTVLSDEISAKVSSDEVESMITVALDEIEITSEHIKLEGYTTINGGFSIDEKGNAMFAYYDNYATMTAYGLEVGTAVSGSIRCRVSNSGIIFYKNSGDTLLLAAISGNYLEVGTSDATKLYCAELNGGTPITSGNYKTELALKTTDIEVVETSYGNLSFNGINAAGVTYVQNNFARKSELESLETRIAALEAAGGV